MPTLYPLQRWYANAAGEALGVLEDFRKLPVEGKIWPTGKPLDLCPIHSQVVRFRTCFHNSYMNMFDFEYDFLPSDELREALEWAENFVGETTERWGWRPLLMMTDIGLGLRQSIEVLAATRPTLTRADIKAIKLLEPLLIALVTEAKASMPDDAPTDSPLLRWLKVPSASSTAAISSFPSSFVT